MEIGLSLGSNLGNRLANLRQAAQRIVALPEVHLVAVAPVYQTEPVGVLPEYRHLRYLNTVLIVDGPTDLDVFSAAIHGIEDELGRRRGPDRNAPRTIDIDFLYAEDTCRADGKLDLPHPRWAQRRFVVQPLADVRPALRLPGCEGTVAEQLGRLPDKQHVRRFAESWFTHPKGKEPA
jgi:2-amino-4-hydroxy-6-hydroxymethyldihydropteridine diphosphokinase